MRSVQQKLAELEKLGIRPVAISVDPPAVTREQMGKAGYTYTFLSDEKATVIAKYDLVHKGAGMNGADVARPAEFLIDKTGVVRWRNLTEDYRVRARPEEVLEQAQALANPR